jgi:hypothetical protein
MTDEDLAANVRKCADDLNMAIKAAANAGVVCTLRLGQADRGRPTTVVVRDENATDPAFLIDMTKRL